MILNLETHLPQSLEFPRGCEDNLRETSAAELEKKIARLQHLVAELLAVNQQLRDQLEN